MWWFAVNKWRVSLAFRYLKFIIRNIWICWTAHLSDYTFRFVHSRTWRREHVGCAYCYLWYDSNWIWSIFFFNIFVMILIKPAKICLEWYYRVQKSAHNSLGERFANQNPLEPRESSSQEKWTLPLSWKLVGLNLLGGMWGWLSTYCRR